MSLPKGTKRSRDVWLEKETYTMLETFIIYKDILNRAYSTTVTKERKNSFWKEITSVIHNDHPECGGPFGEDGILRPIYQKYCEVVLGLDNPAVSATAIPGAIDTDDLTVVAKNAVLQQRIVLAITGRSDQPTEEVIPNETLMESSENNQLVATHYSEEQHYVMDQNGSSAESPMPPTTLTRLEIECWPAINMDKGKTLKNKSIVTERALFHTSSSSISRPSTPLTSHSSPEPQDAFNVLKQKRDSSTLRQSRLTEQRLKVLSSAMDVREKLKDPVVRDELPEDLVDLLYNLKKKMYKSTV
ncbi:Uncharacterized protein APZ42_005428 [Daphnia magna]|uniref:Regulatory protein zeste n=1 Tax=Daphnia magna TaxID=35525 RepID=A0A162CTF5_9CRUS|nr:Uncharacterized protein APZ42_005428 [Daphnia magna]